MINRLNHKIEEMRMVHWMAVSFLVLFVWFAPEVHASAGTMPWDTGLTQFMNNLTGPTAIAVSTLGIVGAGGALIFAGQEMGATLKTVIMIVLAGSLMGGASIVASSLMSPSGAIILAI